MLAQLAVKARLVPEQVAAARAWLAEQLVAAEFAKLGQGGYTESRVPLQRVFVDLPVSDRPGQTDHSTPALFLAQLIDMGARSLEAEWPGDSPVPPVLEPEEPCDDESRGIEDPGKPRRREPVGYLLIGGPGQGKSTLGQLACQLHRAALLSSRKEELDASARNVLAQFTPRSDATGHELALPSEPLLPLAISLPDLSSWLAKLDEEKLARTEPVPALLRFIADQASARQTELTAQALLAMIQAWPTLIFLDGFDEVGSQDDRHRIVMVVQELLSAVRARHSRVQLLATTRPQGYAGELSRIDAPLASRFLIPLGRNTALRYAERLVEAKIQSADLRQKVLERLRQAADEPAMARLMTSPLQVTILAALVQHGGTAPRERWTLFKSYFDFTYRREIERDSYASPLLSRQRGHIEQVHLRVALLLQVESEESGGASAQMGRERLEEIIDTVLREDEVAEQERHDLVRQVLDAAERRLVFLVEPEPGRFGFEIRSLQEFMAAWALTEGSEGEIEARMLQIAPAPMFRNVLLFVASRLYSEGHRLRERFAEHPCQALDEDPNDALLRLSHAGALLALETLEEGAVLTQPKRARALMIRAVGLLDLPPGAEHGRLARVTNDDTRDVLRDAMRQRILDAATKGHPDPLAAWVCLAECCNRERVWASTLLDEVWPGAREPGRILEAIDLAEIRVEPWLAGRMEADSVRVPPRNILGWRRNAQSEEVLPGWFGLLRHVFRPRRGRGGFVPLRRKRASGPNQLPSNPPPHTWRAWCAAVVFELAPSARSLGDALSKIREALPPAEWNDLAWVVSWPLAACLEWAESAEELSGIEASIREGLLGDVHDWQKAESAWTRLSEGEICRRWLETASESAPWQLTTLSVAPPLTAVRFVHARTRSVAEGLTRATACFRGARRVSVRKRLAQICLELLSQASAKVHVSSADVSAWVKTLDRAAWLIPKPGPLSEDDWLALLNEIPPEEAYARGVGAIQAAIEHPSVPVLLRAALFEATWYSEEEDLTSDLVALARKVRDISFESVTVRADVTLLRLLAGDSSHSLMEELVKSVPTTDPWTMELWLRLLGGRPRGHRIDVRSDPLLEAMMVHHAMGNWRHPNSQLLIRSVRQQLQSRWSFLGNPAVWRRLGLTEPLPVSPGTRRGFLAIPESPVVLQALEVKELKGVHEVSLKLAAPPEGQGQWTVLIGPNGSGKTTLLRALVLALRNLRDPAIWPRGAFSSPWMRVGASDAARINVQIDDIARTVLIRSPQSGRLEQKPEQNRPRLFPLFAYGCRRGSALGGVGRAVDTSDDGGPEVATLFDEGAGLVHAETWLIKWEGDALKSETSRLIYDAVCDALCRLLDVAGIEVRDRRLWVIENGRSPLPLEAMSDGYLTTAGWFIDLVARWIELASRHGVAIDGGFLQRMTGLVLLDEIDLHLHPRWQIDVIRRTRALVPRMSFVVTTHNPLTLVGARPEEIWILSEKEGRIVASQGAEAPMLLTGGQIFSRYFGIESTFPADIGTKLHRYGFLTGFAERNDEEQAEMERLRGELRATGIEPGWEEVPRSTIQDNDDSVFVAKATRSRKGRAR